MKTKQMTIIGILAALLVTLPAFAQEQRPGRFARGQGAPGPALQGEDMERAFTPEERAVIRRFIRSRMQERQAQAEPRRQRPDMAQGRAVRPDGRGQYQGRRQDFGPQRFAGQDFRQGRGGQDMPRRYAQEGQRGRGDDRARPQFHGQGRFERPDADRGQWQRPHAGGPRWQQPEMPRGGAAYGPPMRPDAQQDFRRQQRQEPSLRGQRNWQQPDMQRPLRPDDRQPRFEGRRQDDSDAPTLEQRPRRGRQLNQPQEDAQPDEQDGRGEQRRPRRDRNAQ